MRALIAAFLTCLFATPLAAGEVTVFAAASMKTALDRIADGFEQATGHEVTTAYAGSSALARQIQLGAPADLFISANVAWMDVLEDGGLVQPDSRVDLAGNRLALVGPAGVQSAEITAEFDMISALEGGRLAMALVTAVPVGIYGKQALEGLGQWQALAPHVAQSDNARAALALVAVGAAPLGVVYATDAKADPRVDVVGLFPADSHAPIRYPAALTIGAGPEAQAFLDWLRGPEARAILLAESFAEVPE